MSRRRGSLLALVLAALAVLAAAAGALVFSLFDGSIAETTDTDATATPAHPAAEDVEVTSCELDPMGRTRASGFVRNRSSETSDYAVHVFPAPNDEATYARRLEPGATRRWSVTSDEVAAEPISCAVTPTRRSSRTTDGLCEQLGDDPRLRAVAVDVGRDGVDAVQLCGIDSPPP